LREQTWCKESENNNIVHHWNHYWATEIGTLAMIMMHLVKMNMPAK